MDSTLSYSHLHSNIINNDNININNINLNDGDDKCDEGNVDEEKVSLVAEERQRERKERMAISPEEAKELLLCAISFISSFITFSYSGI